MRSLQSHSTFINLKKLNDHTIALVSETHPLKKKKTLLTTTASKLVHSWFFIQNFCKYWPDEERVIQTGPYTVQHVRTDSLGGHLASHCLQMTKEVQTFWYKSSSSASLFLCILTLQPVINICIFIPTQKTKGYT